MVLLLFSTFCFAVVFEGFFLGGGGGGGDEVFFFFFFFSRSPLLGEIFFFFFSRSPAGVHHFWVRFLRMCEIFAYVTVF